ncbi:cytochrome b/b6 domain-containing protein [Pseudovibrio sp. Tun.PSC04-5.I4]|uniref:cytochrome b n=1 Tax=Pseudovibrio sp. Tun.PSC04-5.I4 TaxID=1798213 RepID=UPI0008805229|nr:cytochrome b/b6 domain-containing protein [Pseudovibrio sp. Tun.PSC04-5.I4]SDR47861.1 cytochrome b561 [Pseudovibrio sp. Tun.PSC04-5.I4]
MTNQQYVRSSRILHWLMALGFLAMWLIGYVMTLPSVDETELQESLFDLHISIGVTLLGLLLVRVVIRLVNRPPALPEGLSSWEKVGSHLGHLGLYLLPLIVMVVAWAEVDFGGYGVKWFTIAMPKVFPTMETFAGVNLEEATALAHKWLAWSLLGLVAVHVAAVLKHRYWDGHDVIYRMSLRNMRK